MHLSVLIFFVRLCEPYIDRENDESLGHDSDFKPNLKNSVMFIYQWFLQSVVILVNYSGRPFTQDISENSKLLKMMGVMFVTIIAIVFDYSSELREYMELVPFPNFEFQMTIIVTLVVDFIICWSVEKYLKTQYLKTFEEERRPKKKVKTD